MRGFLLHLSYTYFPSVTVIYNNYLFIYIVAFMYISFQLKSTYALEQALISCVIFQACHIKQ